MNSRSPFGSPKAPNGSRRREDRSRAFRSHDSDPDGARTCCSSSPRGYRAPRRRPECRAIEIHRQSRKCRSCPRCLWRSKARKPSAESESPVSLAQELFSDQRSNLRGRAQGQRCRGECASFVLSRDWRRWSIGCRSGFQSHLRRVRISFAPHSNFTRSRGARISLAPHSDFIRSRGARISFAPHSDFIRAAPRFRSSVLWSNFRSPGLSAGVRLGARPTRTFPTSALRSDFIRTVFGFHSPGARISFARRSDFIRPAFGFHSPGVRISFARRSDFIRPAFGFHSLEGAGAHGLMSGS